MLRHNLHKMRWLLIRQDPEPRCFPKIIPKIINAHTRAARTVFNSLQQSDRHRIGFAGEEFVQGTEEELGVGGDAGEQGH